MTLKTPGFFLFYLTVKIPKSLRLPAHLLCLIDSPASLRLGSFPSSQV